MLFSIVIPYFNCRYITDCLDSILNQIYHDYEVIIVDIIAGAAVDGGDALLNENLDRNAQFFPHHVDRRRSAIEHDVEASCPIATTVRDIATAAPTA